MRYRRHIDGLRAVAILPVVGYHLDLPLFSGGFTGVDIFFVISGFLITSMIVSDLDNRQFSIMDFYRRRALRILPAYVAMIAAVIAAAWFLMLPEEALSLGRTVIAASIFASNFYFWKVTGYFNPGVEDEPLIHTWTLSTEEQFYLVLPWVLILIAGVLRRRYGSAILVLAIASFGLSVAGLSYGPTGTFYLLPTRAWEFGLGGLAAIWSLETRVNSRLSRNLLSLLGLGLIGYGILALGPESPFPGVNALFPVVGAVLLISMADGTVTGNVLSTRPVVAIGRISYSLYLWHWPIIVFYKIAVGPQLSVAQIVMLAAVSVMVAGLSYRFIEQPFRTQRMRTRPAIRVNLVALVSILATVGAGIAVVRNASDWGAYPAEIRRVSSYMDYREHMAIHPCFVHQRTPGQFEAFDPETCLATPDTSKPTYLIAGDSHAEHLMPAFAEHYPEVNMEAAGGTGCRPLIQQRGDWYCPQIMRLAIDKRIPEGGIDGVILSARWEADEFERLHETVDFLSRYVDRIVILGPTPEYLDSFPKLLARGLIRDRTDMSPYANPEVPELDAEMAAEDWGPKVRYISMYDLLCADGCPSYTEGGVPFHPDYGHYTREAAVEVMDKLDALGLIPPQG